jgi:hypothetical protein
LRTQLEHLAVRFNPRQPVFQLNQAARGDAVGEQNEQKKRVVQDHHHEKHSQKIVKSHQQVVTEFLVAALER